MSIQSILFNYKAAKADQERDSEIPVPKGISQCCNISYGPHGQYNLLDVYFPDGTAQPLPTIVSIHGGGYVYGTKEVYRRYGMDMARRGFTFVNFNYRLAPRWHFPAPLEDTNAVLEWVCKNAENYHLDPNRIFLVGDSAGAQLASQYAAIASNPEYAALFSFQVPPISIRALGLNCGMYDVKEYLTERPTGLARDYLGRTKRDDPRLDVLGAITSDYPPSYIATAHHDFLKDKATPMYNFLLSKHIKCAGMCYGAPDDDYVGHVFHINIPILDAIRCNDDECAFFRNCL